MDTSFMRKNLIFKPDNTFRIVQVTDTSLYDDGEINGALKDPVKQSASASAKPYDLDAMETKIQKIKTLTALNVFISELNGVLVDMHKNNSSDYNRFYAFWKKQEKDINDGTA